MRCERTEFFAAQEGRRNTTPIAERISADLLGGLYTLTSSDSTRD